MQLSKLLCTGGLIVSVIACNRSSPPAETVLRDSAGVTMVENATASWQNGRAWQMAQTPALRIGSGAGPAEQFTYIRGLTRLGNGNIVVADGQTREIRWFDSAGVHLATRGGRGRGPGEFTSLPQIVRLSGDTVLAQNAPFFKQVLYSGTAELVREEPIDGARYRAFGRWLECLNLTLPDRSLLGCQEEPGLPASAPGRPGHLRTFARYIRVPWTMESAHRLGLYGGIEQWGIDAGNGRMRYAVHPFHARTTVAAGGDSLRIAIALNPEYSIQVWTPDGRLERIIRRVAARRAPTPQERGEARERLRRYGRGDEAIFNRFIAEMEEPDSIPAVGSLAFGPRGDLWVTRGGLFSLDKPVMVDVFDREGLFLGELHFPPRFRIFEVGHDYVLGVRIDENDVQTVELYSLMRNRP